MRLGQGQHAARLIELVATGPCGARTSSSAPEGRRSSCRDDSLVGMGFYRPTEPGSITPRLGLQLFQQHAGFNEFKPRQRRLLDRVDLFSARAPKRRPMGSPRSASPATASAYLPARQRIAQPLGNGSNRRLGVLFPFCRNRPSLAGPCAVQSSLGVFSSFPRGKLLPLPFFQISVGIALAAQLLRKKYRWGREAMTWSMDRWARFSAISAK